MSPIHRLLLVTYALALACQLVQAHLLSCFGSQRKTKATTPELTREDLEQAFNELNIWLVDRVEGSDNYDLNMKKLKANYEKFKSLAQKEAAWHMLVIHELDEDREQSRRQLDIAYDSLIVLTKFVPKYVTVSCIEKLVQVLVQKVCRLHGQTMWVLDEMISEALMEVDEASKKAVASLFNDERCEKFDENLDPYQGFDINPDEEYLKKARDEEERVGRASPAFEKLYERQVVDPCTNYNMVLKPINERMRNLESCCSENVEVFKKLGLVSRSVRLRFEMCHDILHDANKKIYALAREKFEKSTSDIYREAFALNKVTKTTA